MTDSLATKCVECGEEIPSTHACLWLQEAKTSIHLECAPKKKRVFKIELNGPGNALITTTLEGLMNEVQMLHQEGVEGDDLRIQVEEMTAGQFHNLPEHGGW